MSAETTILAIDQGTSGTTALIFDVAGNVKARAYRQVAIAYPQPGWVEQDADALFASVIEAAREAVKTSGSVPTAVGITNQRETIVLVDRATLQPVAPAIVWQCRRSTDICAEHRDAGHQELIRQRTGLLLDPYFSATKLEWLFRSRPDLLTRAQRGELAALTIDAWLVCKLSGGRRIATDASNASRTLLFDITRGIWDPELCDLFGVPTSLLPEIVDSTGWVADVDASVTGWSAPICGIAGDQQAALFGQGCVQTGMSKNTYGTGSFVLVNAGTTCPPPAQGLLTTVAWRLNGTLTYALEGSIFVTGAGLKWLRDELHLIERVEEAGPLFDSVADANGCFFVPALAGLGAPYWDAEARGALLGLTGGVGKAHVVRAVVEAMAYRTRDVVEAMESAAGVQIGELRVDGGASVMDGLCQFQADLLGLVVARPAVVETTARGTAMLAAVGAGLLPTIEATASSWVPDARFAPREPGQRPQAPYAAWQQAVGRVRSAS